MKIKKKIIPVILAASCMNKSIVSNESSLETQEKDLIEKDEFPSASDHSTNDIKFVSNVIEEKNSPAMKVSPGSVVMLVGDSLAVGMNDEFKKLAKSAGYVAKSHVQSGTNAMQWNSWIKKDIELYKPSLVLISLGTNDAAGYDVVIKQKQNVFANLAKQIEDNGGVVVWIGPPAIKKSRISKIEETKQFIKESVSNYFASEQVNLILSDGIHASPTGYKNWIREVWKWMSKKMIVQDFE